MIKSITVTNYLGDSLKLDLMRPEESGFIVESITGLGPGKANINTTETATNDGSSFNSSRVASRNIVISLRYMWKSTIEESRHRSYKYFPLKRKVTLTVETDTRTATIEGYVESNDPTIFSKESGSDISIICPDPFFYSVYGGQITTFGGIEPMFEFPFSNESLTEPLLEFAAIKEYVERTVLYEGEVETGVTMIIRATGEASGITIYNVETLETMKIDTDMLQSLTGYGLIEGDELSICTTKGKKSAVLIRNGQRTNVLNCVDRNSDWFQLSKGENIFSFTAEEGRSNLNFEIQNDVVYEGV